MKRRRYNFFSNIPELKDLSSEHNLNKYHEEKKELVKLEEDYAVEKWKNLFPVKKIYRKSNEEIRNDELRKDRESIQRWDDYNEGYENNLKQAYSDWVDERVQSSSRG